MRLPAPMALYQTMAMEHPFAWRSERYFSNHRFNFFSQGQSLTISFTAKRSSKAFAYIPIIGSIIGLYRLYYGYLEYRYFHNIHLHSPSSRSVQWMKRGALETIPVIGTVVCLIIDIYSTISHRGKPTSLPLKDATPCGLCHTCGHCKC